MKIKSAYRNIERLTYLVLRDAGRFACGPGDVLGVSHKPLLGLIGPGGGFLFLGREAGRREKTMELMEWTEDKPGADGFYWAYAGAWGMGITPILIEVKDGLYKPVHSPRWRRIDAIIERYKFAGPIQPPEIDAVQAYEPERRRAARVRV